MKITKLIDNIDVKETGKFIVIIGSGIHSQALSNDSNPIASWHGLLKSIDPINSYSENYILDFENLIRKRTARQKVKSASEIEKGLLNEVAVKLQELSEKAIKNHYPMGMFNPEYVSDVISLNFDTVPERILSEKNKLKSYYHELKTSNKLSPEERNALLYHEAGGIRFWHPHGTIEKPSSIQLGIRKYGMRISMVEKLRTHYKSKSRDGQLEDVANANWYDLLTTRPIIICGASLSHAEWDIWTALVNRSRNYARYPKHEQPIYIMTNEPGLYEKRSKDSVNYFIPLTSKKESFTAQWNKLEKLFSSKK